MEGNSFDKSLKSNVRLGRTLYEAAIEQRPSSWPEVRNSLQHFMLLKLSKVEWRGFSGSRGYAHNHICRAPELPQILRSPYILPLIGHLHLLLLGLVCYHIYRRCNFSNFFIYCLLCFLVGCNPINTPAIIENNQSIYFGKNEKYRFVKSQTTQSVSEIAQEYRS